MPRALENQAAADLGEMEGEESFTFPSARTQGCHAAGGPFGSNTDRTMGDKL